MRKTFRKRERACARLEGLILRRRAAPSRRMRTSQRMRPHASRRIAARHGGRKDLRACRAAMLLSMRARNAFWRNEPNRVLAERTPLSLRSAGTTSWSVNLRLQKTTTGEGPLFRACSLQGTVQLQRVEPQRRPFSPNEPNRVLAKRTQPHFDESRTRRDP